LTRPQIFFAAVVALYAVFIVRWAFGKLRARNAARPAKTSAAVQKKKLPAGNPFTPHANILDSVVDMFEPVLDRLLGDDPIMREKINEGSDKFFVAEDARNALIKARWETDPLPPAEIEEVRDLWPKPVHQSRERGGLPDVGKPTDPGDGSL
jgi:hypothetical protein